eukprot:gene18330-biopygen21944
MFSPPVGEHGTRVVTSGRGARTGMLLPPVGQRGQKCCYLRTPVQKCSQLRSGSADRNVVTSGRGPVLSPGPELRRGRYFARAGTSPADRTALTSGRGRGQKCCYLRSGGHKCCYLQVGGVDRNVVTSGRGGGPPGGHVPTVFFIMVPVPTFFIQRWARGPRFPISLY